MGFTSLTSYDPSACAEACNTRGFDSNGPCIFFNIWTAVVNGTATQFVCSMVSARLEIKPRTFLMSTKVRHGHRRVYRGEHGSGHAAGHQFAWVQPCQRGAGRIVPGLHVRSHREQRLPVRAECLLDTCVHGGQRLHPREQLPRAQRDVVRALLLRLCRGNRGADGCAVDAHVHA